MLRRCIECHWLKDQSEFRGTRNKCKDCSYALVRRWKKSNQEQIKKHRTEIALYRQTIDGRQKHIARWKLQYAVNCGRIIRPDSCQNCQTSCKPHGHHYLGYDREHWYDVIWLCHKCHVALENAPLGGVSCLVHPVEE